MLEASKNLIGELVVNDADEPGAEDNWRAPTLTMQLLTEKARTSGPTFTPICIGDGAVPVVDPIDPTTGLESLWLPGMTKALQRTVVRRRRLRAAGPDLARPPGPHRARR